MSPSSGGSSSSGSGGSGKKEKKPSGIAFPSVKPEHLAGRIGEDTQRTMLNEIAKGRSGIAPNSPEDDDKEERESLRYASPPPMDPRMPYPGQPMPVSLVPGTFWKMMGIFLIPTFGLVSAGFAAYWKMNVHMENRDIHAPTDAIEKRVDSRVSQTVELVKKEVKLQIDEVKLSQRKEINKLGESLTQDLMDQQKKGLDKILEEVKKTRKVVRGSSD